MDPRERILAGLAEVSAGLVDLRAEHERVARQQAQRQAVLVGAEDQARGLALRAHAARRPRHLQPLELEGPRRRLTDGTPVSLSTPDAITLRSLATMGLLPRPGFTRDPARELADTGHVVALALVRA